MDSRTELTLDNIIKNNLNGDQIKEFNRIYYGRESHNEIDIKNTNMQVSKSLDLQVAAYKFPAANEETRSPRIVKLGLIQHSAVLPTDELIPKQREAIFNKVGRFLQIAASEGVEIICLQEVWPMPFFLCTKEREKWAEFAESSTDGASVRFLSPLAKKYNMVIISPILEVDDDGKWWNTAVVIDEKGVVMGKHRKNHLPSVGSFSEISYYSPGNTGHPVFNTKYAKIAVNICYGRHQALNWLMFGLNGAEIVFNPAATISEFGESFWGVEARNAAIANSYYTCSINRVGTEIYYGKNEKISRNYYGSSYVTAPDGSRTPSMSRIKDGLLLVEVDLNLCRQMKDTWGFNMTARLDVYAEKFNEFLNNNRSK